MATICPVPAGMENRLIERSMHHAPPGGSRHPNQAKSQPVPCRSGGRRTPVEFACLIATGFLTHSAHVSGQYGLQTSYFFAIPSHGACHGPAAETLSAAMRSTLLRAPLGQRPAHAP